MAWQIRYSVNIDWVGEGTAPGASPQPVQTLNVSTSAPAQGSNNPIQVPSTGAAGATPTSDNITTACTSMATQVAAQLAAQLSTIQAWASGGN
jgi:hypothetical protein